MEKLRFEKLGLGDSAVGFYKPDSLAMLQLSVRKGSTTETVVLNREQVATLKDWLNQTF